MAQDAWLKGRACASRTHLGEENRRYCGAPAGRSASKGSTVGEQTGEHRPIPQRGKRVALVFRMTERRSITRSGPSLNAKRTR
jgi:hypothetical protein